jgi:hypothetical protein
MLAFGEGGEGAGIGQLLDRVRLLAEDGQPGPVIAFACVEDLLDRGKKRLLVSRVRAGE